MNHFSDILLSQKINICWWGCPPQFDTASPPYEIVDHLRINFQEILASLMILYRNAAPILRIYMSTFLPVILSAILLSYVILETQRSQVHSIHPRVKNMNKTPRRPVTRSMTKAQLANA